MVNALPVYFFHHVIYGRTVANDGRSPKKSWRLYVNTAKWLRPRPLPISGALFYGKNRRTGSPGSGEALRKGRTGKIASALGGKDRHAEVTIRLIPEGPGVKVLIAIGGNNPHIVASAPQKLE
jgi:hypothetical protein